MGKRGRKKKHYDWEQDATVENWLGKLTKTDADGNVINKNTIVNMRRAFNFWMDFAEIEPSQQIEMRAKQLLDLDPRVKNYWEEKMRDYKQHLHTLKNRKGKRISSATIENYLKAPASFFRYNGLRLSLESGFWSDIEPAEREKVVTKWVPSNEHVRLMYKRAESYRDKALLLTLYQSGFTPIDVSALRIEHFPEIYSETPQHHYIAKLREKTNVLTQTCLSREAIHDLRYYLEDRGNPKEGWLFLSHKGEQLGTRYISEAMKRIAEKTFGEERAKQFQTRHLRDAYKNALQRAKLGTETVDKLFGHKRAGAKEAYGLEQALIEEAYTEAFEYMSINGITQSTQDVGEVVKRQKEQSERIDMLLNMVQEERKKSQEQAEKIDNLAKLNADLEKRMSDYDRIGIDHETVKWIVDLFKRADKEALKKGELRIREEPDT